MADQTSTPPLLADRHPALWDAWVQAQHDLSDADLAIQALNQREQTLLSADTDLPIDERLSLLDGMEDQKADLNRRLSAARNRVLILGDELHAKKVEGRGRQIADLKRDIGVIEARMKERQRQINEHTEAIQALLNDGAGDEQQVRILVGRAAKLEPRTDRVTTVATAVVDPYRVPSGLLVRPSVWHAFITAARRRGIVDAQITVDELTGTIVRSPLDL